MPKYGAAPAAFVVMQDCKPRKGKPGEPYTARMGGYQSLKDAKDAIKKNERDIRNPNTFGGLIDWGDDLWDRHYRIYKAEYVEVA